MALYTKNKMYNFLTKNPCNLFLGYTKRVQIEKGL